MEKYPKFKPKEECAFPDRKDCNYGDGYDRCPYMKYDNSQSIFSSTRWKCIFKKENKCK
jgi:hypothetical protein